MAGIFPIARLFDRAEISIMSSSSIVENAISGSRQYRPREIWGGRDEACVRAAKAEMCLCITVGMYRGGMCVSSDAVYRGRRRIMKVE